MGTSSRKELKIFSSYRETTHGTPHTTAFIELRGLMPNPVPEWQYESDEGKSGSGEFGTKHEAQAVFCPWNFTSGGRMSEIAYFISYFQGKRYTPTTVGSLEQHELFHWAVENRVMDTFSFERGTGGTGNNEVYAGSVVNEFSFNIAQGGNGKAEFSAGGFTNKHRIVAQEFALNAAGNMSSGAFDISSEPIVNYKCCRVWKGDSANTIKANSASFGGENLNGNVVEITNLIDSITITGNNGMSGENLIRAGDCGIINNWERGDKVYTLEVVMRKDTTNGLDTDTMLRTDDQIALEIQFIGPYIAGTDPYVIDFVFPVVQAETGETEDDGSPIAGTIPFKVYQDSTDTACEIFVQSEVGTAYNATV